VKIAVTAAHFRSVGVALARPWNPVEKVGIGPFDDHDLGQNSPKSVILVANRGFESRMEKFFNSLTLSPKVGE
jgi:hypothetical protein